jgi:hypothetical protein
MGETADAVKDRAGEVWKETKRRGADLASKGLEEAERQGLTAEAAGAAARSIVSKVAGLAEKAGNDIADGPAPAAALSTPPHGGTWAEAQHAQPAAGAGCSPAMRGCS